ncbi:MAG: hypothetical protein IPQ13_14355 [Holophagaceae bacterium]|nr:hypothetical protein [Holophagaceae bacterium]
MLYPLSYGTRFTTASAIMIHTSRRDLEWSFQNNFSAAAPDQQKSLLWNIQEGKGYFETAFGGSRRPHPGSEPRILIKSHFH